MIVVWITALLFLSVWFRTPLMLTLAAQTTPPVRWLAGCPWKLNPYWTAGPSVSQPWQSVWGQDTLSPSWETPRATCTRWGVFAVHKCTHVWTCDRTAGKTTSIKMAVKWVSFGILYTHTHTNTHTYTHLYLSAVLGGDGWWERGHSCVFTQVTIWKTKCFWS